MGLFDSLGSSFGSAPQYNPPPKIAAPIQAPAAAPVRYDSPQIFSTPSPIYQAPTSNYGGGGSVGGGTGLYQPGDVTSSPAAPPKPDYTSADYLNGGHDSELDGTFRDQAAMYASKLKKYVADYEAQAGKKAYGVQGDGLKSANLSDLLSGGSMGVDYNNARDGIQRNRDLGLRGVTEDFANRGMVNSGLYSQDFNKSRTQYDLQGQNLDQGVRNQLQTLDFNRGNAETDNKANIAAARRDALNRLSQSQTL